MFMPQTIERLILRGGNVTLSASGFMPQTLERFAALSAQADVTLTLKDCSGFMPQTLERIAAIGKGKVVFVLD